MIRSICFTHAACADPAATEGSGLGVDEVSAVLSTDLSSDFLTCLDDEPPMFRVNLKNEF